MGNITNEFDETEQRIFDNLADDGSDGDETDSFNQAIEEVLNNHPEMDDESDLWNAMAQEESDE